MKSLIASSLLLALALASAPASAEEIQAPNPDQKESKDSRTVRFGALAGVGFPRPLSVEGLVVFDKVASVGLEYGVLPTITVSGVEASSKAFTLDGRVFPWRGPFFVGLRGGRQTVDAKGTLSSNGITATESLSLETWFVNPRVGFLWTFEPGFALAMEVGVQIPIASHTTSSLPTGLGFSSNVTSTAQTLGQTVIPTIDLLRIGVVL